MRRTGRPLGSGSRGCPGPGGRRFSQALPRLENKVVGAAGGRPQLGLDLLPEVLQLVDVGGLVLDGLVPDGHPDDRAPRGKPDDGGLNLGQVL